MCFLLLFLQICRFPSGIYFYVLRMSTRFFSQYEDFAVIFFTFVLLKKVVLSNYFQKNQVHQQSVFEIWSISKFVWMRFLTQISSARALRMSLVWGVKVATKMRKQYYSGLLRQDIAYHDGVSSAVLNTVPENYYFTLPNFQKF